MLRLGFLPFFLKTELFPITWLQNSCGVSTTLLSLTETDTLQAELGLTVEAAERLHNCTWDLLAQSCYIHDLIYMKLPSSSGSIFLEDIAIQYLTQTWSQADFVRLEVLHDPMKYFVSCSEPNMNSESCNYSSPPPLRFRAHYLHHPISHANLL